MSVMGQTETFLNDNKGHINKTTQQKQQYFSN